MKGPFDSESSAEIMRNRRGPITVDVQRLTVPEIVLLKRLAVHADCEGFPGFDRYVEDFDEQLERLPEENLPFAREVYAAFAESSAAIDRFNVISYLRPLTLVDHDIGLQLRQQLVRDEHPEVSKTAFEVVHHILANEPDGDPLHSPIFNPPRSRQESLALEGLTLEDALQLRNAYLGARVTGKSVHVLGESAVTMTVAEALDGYVSAAWLD